MSDKQQTQNRPISASAWCAWPCVEDKSVESSPSKREFWTTSEKLSKSFSQNSESQVRWRKIDGVDDDIDGLGVFGGQRRSNEMSEYDMSLFYSHTSSLNRCIVSCWDTFSFSHSCLRATTHWPINSSLVRTFTKRSSSSSAAFRTRSFTSYSQTSRLVIRTSNCSKKLFSRSELSLKEVQSIIHQGFNCTHHNDHTVCFGKRCCPHIQIQLPAEKTRAPQTQILWDIQSECNTW